MKNNHVLCAIDVNDYDPALIELAVEYAAHFGGALDLLHVTVGPDPMRSAWPHYFGPSTALINDNHKLKSLAQSITNVPVNRHHLTGTPSEKILEFAQQHRPHLLVIGTHGRKGLTRVFGSVATAVMRQADCPVLIYRQQQTPDLDRANEQNAGKLV